MASDLNVGIIGAGRIGRLHAEHLALRVPGARPVAIADAHLPSAERCAADLGIPSVFGDAADLLARPEVEAVLICSSTDTHAPLIEAAAAAGKHIFCEKPIDFDLARIDRALAIVDKAGVKLQIGFNRRFDANFRRVREIVAGGGVGTPHLLRITSRDPEPPPLDYVRGSGGIFLDMTIHDFDMARFLLDDEVEEVFATGASLVDPGIGELGDVDTCIVTLRFTRGALGAIDNSRKAVYGYDQRVEVFGSEGNALVANNTPDRAIHSDATGVHSALPQFFFVERYTESYIEEVRSFVRCVREDTAPPVTGRDGRAPVVLGLAAGLSLREKRPVRLEEITGGR